MMRLTISKLLASIEFGPATPALLRNATACAAGGG